MSSKQSDTIREIGGAIRRLRQSRGMSLRDLGELSGFSIGFLSLVERGRSSLAISSLERVAEALDTSIADLLPSTISQGQPEPLPHITRGGATDEVTILGRGRTYILLSGRAPNRILEPILLIIQPTESLEEPYGHEGEEFLYILEGEIVCVAAGGEERLRPGDSIHLVSETPHTFRNDSTSPAKAIFVSTRRFF